MIPYRDFELVFPPLYTYINVVIVLIFGEHLIVFRAIGVLLFVGLAVLIYYIFKLISPSWIAAVAATVTIFVLQSEVASVAYDYIRFYDLFNYLAFFLILRPIMRSYKREPVNINLNLFLAGIFCALAVLMRQSSGVIVFIYFTIFLVLISLIGRTSRKNLYCFFIGSSVPTAITIVWLVLVGAFTPFIEMTLLSESKGSITSMFFNWIPRMFNENFIVSILIIVIPVSFAILLTRKKIDARPANNVFDFLFYFIFIALVAVSIVALFFSLSLSSRIPGHLYHMLSPMFILSFVLGIIILFKIIHQIRKKEHISYIEAAYLFFCGFIFAVGFGSGTSGALSLGQGALNFGFIVAIILDKIERVPKAKLKACLKTPTMALILFLFIATPVSDKVITPYSWWGLTAENYSDANFETHISYFKYIKMTADEKYVYENFVEKASLYLGDDDELYCYSQITIFYALANKVPTVKAPVAWFDVSRDKTILEDLEYLTQNNPKMIIFADHGEWVLRSHEELFNDGNELGHRKMYEWLIDLRDDTESNYTTIEVYRVHNYHIYLMLRDG